MTIPEGVRGIGSSAFYDCSSLMSVTIPDSVTRIDWYAFSGCSSLTTIAIPESVTSISSSAFSGCSSLAAINVAEGNTAYSSAAGILFNKDKSTLLTYPTGKTEAAYSIPNSVTSIDSYAFSGCSSLTSVTLPDSVMSISGYAFSNCSSLTSVTLPDSVTYIGDYTFAGCSSLTSVTIPDSVTYIGDGAFRDCSSLTSVTILNPSCTISTIEVAGKTVLHGYANSTAKNYAEQYGKTFTTHEYEEGVCTICGAAPITYKGTCGKALTWEFSVDSGILTISGTGTMTAYSGSLSGSSAPWYKYCGIIRAVVIDSGATSIGSNAFRDCRNLTNVTIPNGVMSIGECAFLWCSRLTSVTIGNSVTSIGSSAFQNCSSLMSVTIPDSVTSIGSSAFGYCGKLSHVHFLGNMPTFGGYAFSNCASDLSLCYIEGTTGWDSCAYTVEPWDYTLVTDCTSFIYTCNTCGEVYTVASEDAHAWTLVAEDCTSPTCTEQGKVVYTCALCDAIREEIIAALGHSVVIDEFVAPTCTETGLTEGSHCDRCSETLVAQKTVNALGHDAVTDAAVAPTCTETGLTEGSHCDRCGEVLVAQKTVDALGHNAVTDAAVVPTCTETGLTEGSHCDRCGETLVAQKTVDALGHSAVTDAAVAPTCTETGLTEGSHCDRGGEPLVAQKTVDALGHNAVTDAAVAPTCTETGLTEGSHCDRCGEVLVAQKTVDALGHSAVTDAAVAPTCTGTGLTEGSHCDRCGEVLVAQKTVDALGHNAVTDAAVVPTCTEIGLTEGSHCDRCGEVLVAQKTVDALGHNAVTDAAVAPTCTGTGLTEGSHCNSCGETLVAQEAIAALGHSYIPTTTLPNCTAQGFTTYTCSVCADTYTADYVDALGHTFGEWKVSMEATCIADGLKTRTCIVCAATETEKIAAVGHNFSAWKTSKASTIFEAGEKTRSCTVCGVTEKETLPKLTADTTAGYGLAQFTVVDATTKEPIPNAAFYFTTEADGEGTVFADREGKLTQALPVGINSFAVYAEGYSSRTIRYTIEVGTQVVPAIGLSEKPMVEGKLTATEMTLEEIEEAGIDTTVPENQQVYKYETTITFGATIDWLSIVSYINVNGDVLQGNGGGSSGSGTVYYYTGDNTPIQHEAHDPITGEISSYTIIPVNEKFFLIIDGEARWLKEMYDVQLLILNHSMTDTIENCVATLELPKGLSLAAMVEGEQSLSQNIDTISEGGSACVHWYVRGDQEGDYTLAAKLSGDMMPFEEHFEYEYTAENSIHVYAGSALHITYTLPDSAFYGENYVIRIEIENVSDKPIYNLSHYINGLKQAKITWESNGTVKEETLSESTGKAISSEKFLPGDKLIIEVSVNVLFESEMIQNKLRQYIGLVNGAENLLNAYHALKNACDIVNGFYSIIEKSIWNIDGILNAVELTDKVKVNACRSLLKELTALWKLFASGDEKKALEIANCLLGSNMSDVIDILKDRKSAEEFINTHDAQAIYGLAREVHAIVSRFGGSSAAENFDFFDALRRTISLLPTRFYVEDIVVTTLAGSTTEIPYTINMEPVGAHYFGIDNVGKYLYSLVISAFGQIDPPWFIGILGVDDDITGYQEATEYVTQQLYQAEIYAAKDATGEVTFKAWIEPNEDAAKTRDIANDFSLTVDNETAVFEDGKLTFTGNGLISVVANTSAGGTLYVEDSNGNIKTYVIDVVPEHMCSSDTWIIEMTPNPEYDGAKAKYCDVCGDLIAIEAIPLCTEHIFGEMQKVTEADCVTAGISTKECSVCHYIEYTFAEALGHSFSDWQVTEATCTADGERTRICMTCGETEREIIPAIGHQYSGGSCTVCGEADPYYDVSLKFRQASLTLESDISINFYVLDSVLEGWDAPYVVFTKAVYDEKGSITGYETETVTEFTSKAIEDGSGCHVFTFTGIYATEMGSAVTATLYASKDGTVYEGKTVNYSVLQYVTNMLNKSTDAGLRTMLVDLLNYGAAAQSYYGYNAANLVNAGLTEEQQSYATQGDPTLSTCRALIQNEGATVSFKSCTLYMKEKVSINYYLNLANYTGDVDDLCVKISYTDENGKAWTQTIDSSELLYKEYNGSYYYVANFSALNAMQMRTECRAEVFSKATGERISNTLLYSIESFAYSKANDPDTGLAALVNAMMKYGNAVEAYFLP